MSKPKIFISSTYYDLKYIRGGLEQFIDSMGYDSVLFESGDVAFSHAQALDKSCYDEVKNCDILVLIIGGRYGSVDSSEKLKQDAISAEEKAKVDERIEKYYEKYNSITKREFDAAMDERIPVYTFVDKAVHSEYRTYLLNKSQKIAYAHVDNVGIFKLLESIYAAERLQVKDFEKLDDITDWLRAQWAGLFCQYLNDERRIGVADDIKSMLVKIGAAADVISSRSKEVATGGASGVGVLARSDLSAKIEKHKMDLFCDFKLVRFLSRKLEIDLYNHEAIKLFVDSNEFDQFVEKLCSKYAVSGELKASIDSGKFIYRADFRQLKRRFVDLDSLIN